jgi:hypothetical protein
MHKSREFIDIQLAIVIPVCMSELHFEKSEYLSFRDGLPCSNRSYVILHCHNKRLRLRHRPPPRNTLRCR